MTPSLQRRVWLPCDPLRMNAAAAARRGEQWGSAAAGERRRRAEGERERFGITEASLVRPASLCAALRDA